MRSKSSHRSCSIKGAVLKDLAIFTGNQKRLQPRCFFPVSIVKSLRTPILRNICDWLLLEISKHLKMRQSESFLQLQSVHAKSFWVMCHRGFCGSSFIVPSYLRGYFVGPKIFSREFSLDPKFFLVATSKLLYVGIS